jgi:hypothetical protein
VLPFLTTAIRHAESVARSRQIEHQLLRVEYVDLKYEVTRQQIAQQSQMSRVPRLAALGAPTESLAPVVVSDPDAECLVTVARHHFDSRVVLQFSVTNLVPGGTLLDVAANVEPSDADLYLQESDIELPRLPERSTGACYVVLRAFPTSSGAVVSSFTAELRFNVSLGAESEAWGETLALASVDLESGPRK